MVAGGMAHMGFGYGEGENKMIDAAKSAISSPMLETSISGARAVLINITGGKDISIIGFDNITMCEMMLPSVSTIEQPCEKLGEMVVRKLIANITSPAGSKDNRTYTVEHRVILRDSTGNAGCID